MKILVATNHLEITGGSENFTYALIKELHKRKRIEVEYYCDPTRRGEIARRIEVNLGVGFKSSEKYDLILANHTTMVEELHSCGFLIQTCHGILPGLEQPADGAMAYVAISQEIKDQLSRCGKESYLILNGIDCKVFKPNPPIKTNLRRILSLCQGSDANEMIREACQRLNLGFLQASKSNENIFDIENTINQADLVVGIGRSLYDAMACGRACISLDSRSYSVAKDGCMVVGDGYIDDQNIDKSVLHNCTGRGSGRTFRSVDEVIEQIQRYDYRDGKSMRRYALRNLNMSRNVDQYINIYRYATDKQYAAWYDFKRRIANVFGFCL